MTTHARPALLAAAVALTIAAALIATGFAIATGDAAGAAAQPQPVPPLADAPWASQDAGSPALDAATPLPSLRFAAGVSYAEALRRLYVAARTTGRPPADAELAAPLPLEVVYVESDDPAAGLRLSLTAPWGWTADTRVVRPPSVGLPAALTPDEARRRFEEARAGVRAIPEGGWVDVPLLDPCQVAKGAPERRPACR